MESSISSNSRHLLRAEGHHQDRGRQARGDRVRHPASLEPRARFAEQWEPRADLQPLELRNSEALPCVASVRCGVALACWSRCFMSRCQPSPCERSAGSGVHWEQVEASLQLCATRMPSAARMPPRVSEHLNTPEPKFPDATIQVAHDAGGCRATCRAVVSALLSSLCLGPRSPGKAITACTA